MLSHKHADTCPRSTQETVFPCTSIFGLFAVSVASEAMRLLISFVDGLIATYRHVTSTAWAGGDPDDFRATNAPPVLLLGLPGKGKTSLLVLAGVSFVFLRAIQSLMASFTGALVHDSATTTTSLLSSASTNPGLLAVDDVKSLDKGTVNRALVHAVFE